MTSRAKVAAIAALAMAVSSLASPASHAQSQPVRIGFYPGAILSTMFYVAEAKGHFKEAGLDATLQPVQNGPLMNSQMGSGAIDFGVQPPSNVGIASERGLDQVFVAGNIAMPWVLVARSELKLPNKGKYPDVMRDLKGLNWGVYGRGSDGEMFMRVMAQDAKLDVEKDMAWIGVGGPATGLPALKAKQIDVYFTLDPAPAVAAIGGYGQTLLDLSKGEGPSDFKGIIYNGVVTLRKTAERNPAATEAIVKGLEKSYCWINDEKNFKELLALLKTKIPLGELNDAQFEEMVRANVPSFSIAVPAAHFKIWNEMLLRGKLVKSEVDPAKVIWKTVPKEQPKC